MTPPDDDQDALVDEQDGEEPGAAEEEQAGEDGEDDGPDEEDGADDVDEEEGEEAPEPGYALTFEEQEERFPDEYSEHMDILDEMDLSEIRELDLSRAGDYLLWAAAQSLEEQGRPGEAVALLRRLAASSSPHPALSYPEIRLRLHDLLRDRGDYREALAILEQVLADDPKRADACRERRAETLVLSGRAEEGLAIFDRAARSVPDDPWVPLQAAWALVRAGDYDGALSWIGRGERAASRLEDEQETRTAMAEVDRLRDEARARMQRRSLATPPEAEPGEATAPAPSSWEDRRQAILADLDAEEVRLTREPPQSEADRETALGRLTALHQRASSAWDDAVESHAEEAIAGLEDLQWDVVELAERFGLRIPGADE